MTEQINTDYLVAGSGPAGAVLASKLSASGKKIVLLEQGPRFTEADRASHCTEKLSLDPSVIV